MESLGLNEGQQAEIKSGQNKGLPGSETFNSGVDSCLGLHSLLGTGAQLGLTPGYTVPHVWSVGSCAWDPMAGKPPAMVPNSVGPYYDGPCPTEIVVGLLPCTLWRELPLQMIWKLKVVQKAAAHVVIRTQQFDFVEMLVEMLLQGLHWPYYQIQSPPLPRAGPPASLLTPCPGPPILRPPSSQSSAVAKQRRLPVSALRPTLLIALT